MSFAGARRGTHTRERAHTHPVPSRGYSEILPPPNNSLTDGRRKTIHLSVKQLVLTAGLWESYRKQMGRSSRCGSRAAAAALQWQAVDEAPPTPLSVRSLRLPSPPRWQWQVRLEETIPICPRGEGGEGRDGGGMQRGWPAAAAAAAASRAVPAWEKAVVDEGWT